MIKTFVSAVVLLALPSLALAGGCAGGHSKQVISCASGLVYDATTGTCVTDLSA